METALASWLEHTGLRVSNKPEGWCFEAPSAVPVRFSVGSGDWLEIHSESKLKLLESVRGLTVRIGSSKNNRCYNVPYWWAND